MPQRQTAPSSRSAQAKRVSRTPRPAAARRTAQRRRPRMSRLLAWLLSALLGSLGMAHAQLNVNTLPMGGRVVVGSGQLQQGSNTLVITQATPKLGMDWQSFNIGSGALVEFVQPGADSVALNRVVGNSGSEIYGRLRANGQVFLVNPAGVLFAPGAKVDVGGLVASTLDLSQQDFAEGRYTFSANAATGRGTGVVNQGELRANAGGYIALFGNRVDNQGAVQVDRGSVVLASGRAATVSISGSGLISAVVTAGDSGSVNNSGSIVADGGVVTMTAQSAEGVASSLVNNSGIIRANTLVERNGEVWITGDQVSQSGTISADASASGDAGRVSVKADMERGDLSLDGQISARSAQGRGGQVETSAAHVRVAAGTRVTTLGANGQHGTWLIDPTDFTVVAGAGAQTTSSIGADTLSTNLDGGNVTLATAATGSDAGDIAVNAAVSWTASTRLTLSAHRNVTLNANLTATGLGASLAVDMGAGGAFSMATGSKVTLSGSQSSYLLNGTSYTMIRDLAGLQALDGNTATLAGNYALADDILAASTATANGGLGFNPIGNEATASLSAANSFTGRFQGFGHTISDLTINRPGSQSTGLFASAINARIDNLVLTNAAVTGSRYVGSLVGAAQQATLITNVQSTATAISSVDSNSGGVYAGGLVGAIGSGSGAALNRVGTTGTVSGDTNTATAMLGGVIGQMDIGTITGVTSSAGVTATLRAGSTNNTNFLVGGIAGSFSGGNLTNLTASGAVAGGWHSGGLVGRFAPTTGTLTGGQASGNVSSTGTAGGLVGYATGTGLIQNSDATGTVFTSGAETVAAYAGGAVGQYAMTLAPSAVSAAGNVTGGNVTGGVIGWYQTNQALGAGSVVSVAPVGAPKEVNGPRWVGGVVGYSDSTAAMSGLSYVGNVTATGSAGSAGGISGRTLAGVSNSTSSGQVSGLGDVGGLVGRAEGSGGFSGNTSSATVSNAGTLGRVGGLVGYYGNSGALTGVNGVATSTGTVSGGSTTGGLVGTFTSNGGASNVSTATTSTVISGGTLVGGLFGDANGAGTASLTNATARGDVSATNIGAYVGGLAGDFSMSAGMSTVQAQGNVSGGARAGGLVGNYSGSGAISSASSTATTVAGSTFTGNTWTGGLIGYHVGGTVTDATATATVTSNNTTGSATAGGLFGRLGGALTNGSATGNVTVNSVSSTSVGGLVGTADGTGSIQGSTATGSVTNSSTTTAYSGGLVAYMAAGSVIGGTANGNVSGGLYTGGLIGYFTNFSGAVIQNGTALGTVSGRGDAGGIVGYAQGSGSMTASSGAGTVSSSATSTYSVGGAAGYLALTGGMSSITSGATVVTGGAQTGGVVGYYNTSAALANVTGAATSVTGVTWVGGVVGYSNAASITGLTSNATVQATSISGNAGGLAGRTAGSISSSSASGAVSGGDFVGGLVGQADGTGNFTGVSATGNVTSAGGSSYAGGLVGRFSSGNISTSFATGTVTSANGAGGLVGQFNANGSLTDSYATGAVTINGPGYAGGLVATASGSGTIQDSYATGNVTSTNSGAFVGGLAGQFSKPGGMNNVSATGTVSGGNRVGGLVGYYVSGGNLNRATATGTVTGTDYVGGLVGDFVNSGTLSNSEATGAVSGQNYVGGLVGSYYQSGAATTLVARGNVTATTGYAGGLFGLWQYSSSLLDSEARGTVRGAHHAGGAVAYAYSNSTGIDNVKAFGNVTATSINSTLYVGGLVGEMGYTNVARGTAIGSVTAVTESSAYAGGLVGYYYGSNAGYFVSTSTASGAVRVDSLSGYVGGLVGQMSAGAVLQSSASGNVEATDVRNQSSSHYTGGLVGYFDGNQNMSDSTATGQVVGRYMVGGLVGYFGSTGQLINGSATGNVSGMGYAGGLTGYMANGSVQNGVATGNVTMVSNPSFGTAFGGGLVGYANLTGSTGAIADSRASGSVSGADLAGGLVGQLVDSNTTAQTATVSNSSATGNVTGNDTAGGLVGNWTWAGSNTSANRAARTLSTSFATGQVTGLRYSGGLVGFFSGFGGIQSSYATGDVTAVGSSGAYYAGGLVGRFNNLGTLTTATAGQIAGSYATGNVTVTTNSAVQTTTDGYAGGLVGYNDGPGLTYVNIRDSYATGDVSQVNTRGRLRTGGLVGFTDSSITNAYATGLVTGSTPNASSFAGGLVAQASAGATGTGTFWATDSSGLATSALGSGKTTAELMDDATFTGWSLSNTGGSTATWRLYEGLATPLLRGFLTPLTVSLANLTKVYDGTTSLGEGAITVNGTGILHPERILVGGTPAHVGTYALADSNLYSVHNGYDLTLTGTANLTITPRPLSFSGLVQDKVYDSTRTATWSSTPQLLGLVAGEDLSFTAGNDFVALFDTKAVGTDKTVTLSGSYTISNGTRGLASDYTAPSTLSTTASITPATLTAGSFTATNRAYDGTLQVNVAATASTLSGVIAGDTVAVDLSSVSTGTVADKNVGTGKAVSINGVQITGADASNYVLAGASTTTVDITPRAISVNGLAATDRAYNAGTFISVNANSAVLSGAITGDSVQLRSTSLSGSMADKNVGNGKAVTVTGLALRGLDAANYSVQQGSVGVNISPYALTIQLSRTGQTDRTYDGTTNADTTFSQTWWGGDDITVTATSIGYSDKNVAYTSGGAVTSKTITASGLAITGADAANYSLQNTSDTVTGTIRPKALTVSGVAAVNRVYDGSRDVTVNITGATVDTSAVIGNDDVGVATPGTGTVTGQMADKNVGTGKAVTVPGLTLTGADAGNYSITSSTGGGVTVNITPKDLTAVYTGINKVYDANTNAGVIVTSADILSGDSVAFYADRNYCTGCWTFFADRNAGVGKAISISFNGLYGTDAANYTLLNTTGSATADIAPRPVTMVFTAPSKVYDGTTAAAVTLNRGGSGIFTVDAITTTQDAQFTGASGKNVGTGKPISVSNIVASGTGAANYVFSNTTATTTGNVTAKPITLSGITGVNRAYDGTTTVAVVAAGTVGSSGFVAGDTVSVVLPSGGLSTGTIANKNIGTAKPVTVTGLSLTGIDAANYSIDSAASGITVDITPAALTPTYVAVDRVYNGGVSAQVTSTTAGIQAGDTVTFSQQAVYSGATAKDVGSNKPISITNISISGANAANYTLASTTATTTGGITPKPVTVNFVGSSRVYNGLADVTASVVGTSLQFVAGDQVGTSQTAVFTGDGAVGTNKAVNISAISLTGANAANYSLVNSTATTTASITPRPLGVTGISATNRIYDGTTTVAVNLSNATVDTSRVVPGDDVTPILPSGGSSTGTVADRHVGNAKAVSITGITLSGASAANYTLVGATGLTVSILPKPVTATYTAASKVYDGSADATVTGTSSDFLSVDTGAIGITAQGTFTTGKGVGTAKAVDVTGGFLSGASRDDYTLVNTTASTTGTITPRTLTLSYTGGTRVYDGTILAPVTATLGNRVSGDAVGVAQSAEFTGTDASDAGTAKPIAVSNILITGADGGNYTLATTSASTTGTVTRRPITVSGLTNVTATDRVYDGTTTVQVNVPTGVTLTPSSLDIIQGDVVTIDVPTSGITTGSMADKHVGNGKVVSVTGLTLSGADALNYSIAGTAGITVNITPLAIAAVWAGVNRVYDGGVNATASGSSSSVLAGDSLVIRGSGQFTGTGAKNVGTAKPLDITSASLSGADARNYSLLSTTGSATADITPRNVTPSYSGGSRVYDGGTTAPVTSTTSGFIAGDDITLAQTAAFTGVDARNAGTAKPVQVSGITLGGADATNYALTSASATTTGSITPKPLNLVGLSGLSAVDRTYDGTRNVTVNINSTGAINVDQADIIGSDQVAVSAPAGSTTTGTVANKNAGQNKAVTVTGLTLTGADAGNYSIAASSGLSVNVTPRDLTATWAAASRVYDGTTAATVSGNSTLVVVGDSLNITGVGTFTDGKNAGTGKNVAVSAGRLTGGDAANYTLLNTTGSATADVTPRSVTATYIGGSRVYDGTLDAPVSGTLANAIAGDVLTLSESAVFTGDKNVGTGKAVNVTGITLGGVDRDNYSLVSSTASTTASITPRPLRLIGLTGITAADKVYDGTVNVSVTVGTTGTVTADPADLIAGDVVSVNAPSAGTTTGTTATKNVGSNKAVAVTGLSLSGPDAGNYSVANTSGVTVNVTARPVTAVYAAQSRVYDGTTQAAVNASSSDIVSGDSLTISATGSFSGTGAKNVGANKTVDISAGTLTGADASNYSLLNATGTTTASITPRTLTATYVGGSRVYDGTTTAPVTRSLSGQVQGDDVTAAETAEFAGGSTAKSVGTGKAVQVTGITLSGADAANYSLLSNSASTTGTITPRALTVSGLSGITAVDRVYDGTLAVSLNVPGSLGSASGDALSGDQVAVVISGGGIGSGTMLDKHAGLNKSVVLTGLALSGADAGNYFIAGTTGLTVNIAPKSLTAQFSGASRVYDGTTDATVLGGSSDILAGDAVSVTATGTFTGTGAKNVGTGKAISVTGVALTGVDANNYSLTNTTGSASADITQRQLTATYTGTTRVYDGTVDAPVTGSLGGLIAGDTVTATESAVFTGAGARNVGSGKAVSVTGIALAGADAGNYSLAANSAATSASITPRPLTVSGLSGISAQDRMYDGSTTVAVNLPTTISGLSANVIAGDDVTVTVSSGGVSGASMLDKHVGQNKPVVLNGLGLSGADAANYLIGGTLGLTVNIAPRPLSITGVTAVDRVYDGLRDVAIDTTSGSLVGAVSGDDVRLPTTGVTGLMADKNAGQNKAVTVSGLTLAGADLPNYVVSSGAGLTVNITQRSLTPAASVVSKVYDGTTGATVTLAAANSVQGDDASFSGSAVYASRNVGTGIAVAVSGISLAGADAGNYQLSATQLNTTGDITARSLVITPDAVSKDYGAAITLSGTAFSTAGLGLASGETLGSVTLSSAGTAATAAVQGSPYAITASNATGGTFDPANYAITYGSGLLTVRPRPVTVAANSRVLVAGNLLPPLNTYGFSTSVDGLVGSDSLSSVTITPQGLTGTQAVGGYYSLQASNAVFGTGNAANYALSYATGLLVVLPPQPQLGDTGGLGGGGFAVTVTPQERADALDALLAAQRSTAGMGSLRNRIPATVAPLVNALQNLTADELALLLSGDSRKLNPADLLKLPLFTFDPELRRLMQAPDSSRETAHTN